jgi:hypothetical protein
MINTFVSSQNLAKEDLKIKAVPTMNGTDGYGNMKVDVKLDDGQDDVKYDVPYSVTPTKKSQSIARCDAAR